MVNYQRVHMSSQLNLFNQPSLNVLRDVKVEMATAACECGLSRDEICDRMNELAERYGVRLVKGNGRKLLLATLEKWLNPEDKTRMIPVKALPVFCAVTGSEKPLVPLVEPLGFRIINEQEAKLLAWAEHYQQAKRARARMRKLEAEL